MALSIEQQAEFDELVAKRAKKVTAMRNAKREYEAASLEIRAFLAENGLRTARTSNGYVATVLQVIDWRHIDAALAEQDFPREDYPQIYTPDYKALKDAANERAHVKNPDSTAAVSKYTGFVPQLRVSKAKKMNQRRTR